MWQVSLDLSLQTVPPALPSPAKATLGSLELQRGAVLVPPAAGAQPCPFLVSRGQSPAVGQLLLEPEAALPGRRGLVLRCPLAGSEGREPPGPWQWLGAEGSSEWGERAAGASGLASRGGVRPVTSTRGPGSCSPWWPLLNSLVWWLTHPSQVQTPVGVSRAGLGPGPQFLFPVPRGMEDSRGECRAARWPSWPAAVTALTLPGVPGVSPHSPALHAACALHPAITQPQGRHRPPSSSLCRSVRQVPVATT